MMKEFTTFKALLKPIIEELLSTADSHYDADYYGKLFKTFKPYYDARF